MPWIWLDPIVEFLIVIIKGLILFYSGILDVLISISIPIVLSYILISSISIHITSRIIIAVYSILVNTFYLIDIGLIFYINWQISTTFYKNIPILHLVIVFLNNCNLSTSILFIFIA